MKFKKLTAGILTLAITLNTVPRINAETVLETTEAAEMSVSEENMEISGTNSFGNMVARELAAASDEQEANNGCNIFSVEVNGNTASVSFETLYDSTLVVAIYDNEGEQMITSGYTEVTAEETEAKVEISGTIPQYFYIRAYLVNPATLRPLSTEYGSPMYTREMREFLSKTVYDFDPDRVLNLDDDPSTNFAVFGEGTTLIEESGENNVLISADDVTQTYVFKNPDESIIELKAGDILTFENNGELIILETVSVTVDKKTGNATVAGQDAELEEAFEHLRIDGESKTEEVIVDDSNLEDGITYDGMVPDEEKSGIAPQAIDIGGKSGFSLKHTINKTEMNIGDGKVSVFADLNLKIEYSIQLYISHSEMYIQTGLGYSVKTSLGFNGKVTEPLNFMLASLTIPIVPCVNLKMTPGFAIEFEGSATLSGTLTGEIGFKMTYEGIENLNKLPKFELDGEFKAKIFIGLVFEPKLELLNDKIVKAELSAAAGVEIEAVMKGSTDTLTSVDKHECDVCFDGKVTAKFSVEATVQALNSDKLKFKMSFLDVSIPLYDFYISVTYGEFDFTKCPHHSYLTEIKVTDSLKKPLSGAKVTVDRDNSQIFAADDEGKIKIWLSRGSHQLTFEADGYNSKTIKLTVSGSKRTYTISLIADKEETGDDLLGGLSELIAGGSSNSGDLDYGNAWDLRVKQLSLGQMHSGAITNDGCLYMWGYNDHGKLGNGTTEDKYTPVKIMDNVASVSLGGSHSAAITNDGCLYMWGCNLQGQLGDGTQGSTYTPVKIMDNVASVSLGGSHSAAITNDGCLYTWGWNAFGQLHEETIKTTPVKMIDNVASINMGEGHIAAITNDSCLYTWGDNSYGQLGNGTWGDKYTPVKIIDNVAAFSLGYDHSAAITNDGCLYMWGRNDDGQLGDGTLNNKSNPVKIMDNVALVSLTDFNSAVITNDGSLYMWGDNLHGQLGIGTKYGKEIRPVKIMDNVASVSLCYYHSAAITNDGCLYMWGDNSYGQLGNETWEDKSTPVKIMDNVASVSLGRYNSAAITNDGCLYTWGDNYNGSLGNGTTENSSVPIKVTFPTEEPTSPNSEITPIIYNSTPNAPTATLTSLIPNEIYNIYSVGSRTSSNILSHYNLIYIGQATSDSNGTLTIPPAAQNGTVFVKSMHEFDVYNAPITSAEVNNTSVSLQWNPVENASEYEVYCYTTDGILSQTKTTSTSLTINNLEKGKYYGFLVASTVYGEQSVPAINDVVMVLINNTLMGDVNSDEKVNDQDSILLSRCLAEWGNTIDTAAADMNGDGKVNDQDSIMLARTLAGWYD